MISVFQIFKMLIGVIAFIFLLIFFFQFAGDYIGLEEKSSEYDLVTAFDHSAMQAYTSGNAVSFQGFYDFEIMVSAPPKFLFKSGQKTLSVPVFAIPSENEMVLERECEDHEWFKFCWVYAYPKDGRILFTLLDGSGDARKLAKEIVSNLSESMKYGHCSGTAGTETGKAEFGDMIDSVQPSQKCEFPPAEYSRLVTIRAGPSSDEPKENEIIVNRAEGKLYTKFMLDTIESDFDSSGDIHFLLTGGKTALDYKKTKLREELSTAANIMHMRSILLYQKIPLVNIQPCIQCPTPIPMECGATLLDNNGVEKVEHSQLYREFRDKLFALKNVLQNPNSDFTTSLEETVESYNELRDMGCEL